MQAGGQDAGVAQVGPAQGAGQGLLGGDMVVAVAVALLLRRPAQGHVPEGDPWAPPRGRGRLSTSR